ncbi:unnamed protein product [Acanthocheilonema viteae]|uniref:Zinc finger protein unc-98 n=1 Tax=Acanthocheilonema viteae TaxID=6277 RepID=A0A498S545_ACAVI|nr:unnamed protein product [Acanthocheilonema viteae]
MDESVGQPSEQQTSTNASSPSATPTALDNNDMGIISNYQSKTNMNAKPGRIILPSTMPSTPLETSATSPAGVSDVPVSTFIPSASMQTKHFDTGIEDKNNSDFSSSSKNLEQISKLPASVIISTPAVPTDENSVENTPKSKDGFIFYKCRFCGLTYNYLTTLRAHERVHNIDEPYKCNRCSESFHYLCELEYHAKQHTGDEDKESIIATVPTAAKSALPIPESDFPTPEFIEKGFEPKHPLKVYSDVRLNPYICQYCSKSYPNSRMLAYHMYGHRGERIFNPRASRYLMARTENSYISPGF